MVGAAAPFDLDPTGFWDVRMVDGATVVRREHELSKIDQDHLFEPGAAKRALQDVLRLGDPAQVVAERADGSGVTAAQMLLELQADSELGVRYASELSRAAAAMFVRQPRRV